MSIKKRFFTRHPIALRVRVRTPKGWVEQTTLDVSRRGVFIRTDEPMAEHRIVQLRLTMPGGQEIDAMGHVRRVVQDADTSQRGMGVEFFVMSKEAEDEWDRFVLDQSRRATSDVSAVRMESEPQGAAAAIARDMVFELPVVRETIDAPLPPARRPSIAVMEPTALAEPARTAARAQTAKAAARDERSVLVADVRAETLPAGEGLGAEPPVAVHHRRKGQPLLDAADEELPWLQSADLRVTRGGDEGPAPLLSPDDVAPPLPVEEAPPPLISLIGGHDDEVVAPAVVAAAPPAAATDASPRGGRQQLAAAFDEGIRRPSSGVEVVAERPAASPRPAAASPAPAASPPPARATVSGPAPAVVAAPAPSAAPRVTSPRPAPAAPVSPHQRESAEVRRPEFTPKPRSAARVVAPPPRRPSQREPARPADDAGAGLFITVRPSLAEHVRQFIDRRIRKANVFLRSSVDCRPGQQVDVAVVHPDTDAEILVSGTVARVIRGESDAESGFLLRFEDLDAASRDSLIYFAETGSPQVVAPTAVEPEDVAVLRSLTDHGDAPPNAWFALAWALLAEGGDAEEAADAFQNALMLAPDWPQTHEGLALAWALAGDRAKAMAFVRSAWQLRSEAGR